MNGTHAVDGLGSFHGSIANGQSSLKINDDFMPFGRIIRLNPKNVINERIVIETFQLVIHAARIDDARVCVSAPLENDQAPPPLTTNQSPGDCNPTR